MLAVARRVVVFTIGLISAVLAADQPGMVPVGVYLFRVECPGDPYVAEWPAGPGDQGKDYYRIATGHLNFDCSVYAYDPTTDAMLPRRLCRDPGGLILGFPVMLILLGATHCK